MIGPGLGREAHILKKATEILQLCLEMGKPIVLDADGLFLLNDNIELVCGKQNVILTPNAIEFQRIFGIDCDVMTEKILLLGDGVVVLKKGSQDQIFTPRTREVHIMPEGGSGRRCGGQGDLLSGSLATFFFWALQSNESNPAFLAACAASYFVKKLNYTTFQKLGRSMVANDMVKEIPTVFNTEFENKE